MENSSSERRSGNRLPGWVEKSELAERICSPEVSRLLIREGWSAGDLHVHTLFSHDVIPTRSVEPLEIYRKSLEKGFKFIAFTDHDTMDAYDRIGWTRPGVIPAVEIKLLDKKRVGHTIHVNVYNLNRKQFLEILEMAKKEQNVEMFLDYLGREGLPYIYNHPFWHEPGEKPSVLSILELAKRFPVIEYNRGRIPLLNQGAMHLADTTGAGMVANSDTHIGDIGGCYTLARGETFTEFFENIRRRRSFIVTQDLNTRLLKQETRERIRQLANDREWLYKKQFHLETGVPVLDEMVACLASPVTLGTRLVKRILIPVLRVISESGIPAGLYIRSQQTFAKILTRSLNNPMENQLFMA